METMPLCSHAYLIIKWERNDEADITNGYWSIFDGVTYRARAYCLNCNLFINDEDKAAQFAFEKMLTDGLPIIPTQPRSIGDDRTKTTILNKKTKTNPRN
jgi:hypothetical protein